MPVALLLAMQAAGMIVDYIGNKSQIEMSRMGNQLEQASIDSNIETTRLESADASLQAMKQLRQNLGTQAALSAASGGRGNGLSAITSLSNFNADERTRRMNLLSRESQLRAGKILTGMHQLTSETQLGQSMTNRFLQSIPTNFESYSKIGKAIGKGFGLTEIG